MVKKLPAIILLLPCFVGCSTTLEDGYKPRMLNSSSTLRRGYYASPFSPEAAAANPEKKSDQNPLRPGGDSGY